MACVVEHILLRFFSVGPILVYLSWEGNRLQTFLRTCVKVTQIWRLNADESRSERRTIEKGHRYVG